MTRTPKDTMKVIDAGYTDAENMMWLHAKFDEDFGHRESEFNTADVLRLLAEQETQDVPKLRVTIDWWREYAIDPVAPPEDGRYVYVISCLNTPAPIIKIGVASSPEKRVKQLST